MMTIEQRSFLTRGRLLRGTCFAAAFSSVIALVTGSATGEPAKLVVLPDPKPITKVVAFAGPGMAVPRARPATNLQPKARPTTSTTSDPAGVPRAAAKSRHTFGLEPAPHLKVVLDAVKADRYVEARQRARRLEDPFDKKIAYWVIARAPDSGLSADAILKIKASHADWPDRDLLQLRAEQAFLNHAPGTKSVLRFFTVHEPMTTAGRIALADALMTSGR